MLRSPDDYQSYRDKAREFEANTHASRRRLRIPVPADENPYDLPLEQLNVANPELFKHDRWQPYFARLRDEAPLHFCADSQYGPYWSITRFADILKADADHQRFSSDSHLGGVTINGTPQTGAFLPMFIQMDPPQHDQQRATVAPRLAPGSLAHLESTIRERAASILDELPTDQPFDWVDRVARNLTGQMIATLLGVPLQDREKLMHWANVFSNPDNPEVVDSPADFYNALADMGEYFNDLWNARSTAPPEFDFISMLAHSENTHEMSPQQFVGNLVLLLTGGTDTTRNSIAGGLQALNEFPEQYDKLRANPSLIPNMVSEIIRWQTPLTHMARTATQDIELHGQHIRQGDRVMLWYISGNRDPREIDHPEQFDIERGRARHHMSFGFGIHRCLGNRLAEMQLRVLWEEVMQRYPHIDLVGKPQRQSSPLFRGYTQMIVRVVGADNQTTH